MKRAVLAATHAAGGVLTLWESLADGLAARGIATDLVAIYPHGEAGEREDARWRYMVPKRGTLRMLTGVARWLRAERPPVIISAMPAANVLLPLLAWIFSPGTRIIITQHTPVDTYHPLLERLDAWTGGFANVVAIVSVSRTVDASLAGRPAAYRRKCHVIGNALPPNVEALLDGLRPAGERIAHRRTVCAVGRLAEQKNYPVLLHAMALLPDVALEIIGTGPDRDILEALAASLGITDRVQFLGQMPRREALARLTQADVFAQISRWEGHSLALIEAARLALPLVVSDAPVQVEAVCPGDGTTRAMVAGLDNPQEVAEKIRLLLDDAEVYRMMSRSALTLAEDCRFDRMADSYRALVETIA